MRIAAELTAAAPTVIRTVQDRFDWGAAAVGAAAAIALVLIVAAGLSIRDHRTHSRRRI